MYRVYTTQCTYSCKAHVYCLCILIYLIYHMHMHTFPRKCINLTHTKKIIIKDTVSLRGVLCVFRFRRCAMYVVCYGKVK